MVRLVILAICVHAALAARQGHLQGTMQGKRGGKRGGKGPPTRSIVVIGAASSGKSTLVGHLAFRTGAVDRRIVEMRMREAAESGVSGTWFAGVLDSREERKLGYTMTGSTFPMIPISAYQRANFIDVPGREEYIEGVLQGTSRADVASRSDYTRSSPRFKITILLVS